ncbi:MAG TPA: GNAT family N-acetyltransferase [Sulfurivirga caldicuralii]|nr:GNAT family N-acetyltransferase [Sulfurivirga caldicuralii]
MDSAPLSAALSAAVARTERLGHRRGVEVRLLTEPDDLLLQALGRCREEAFAAVGEGTGRQVDLDPFDRHYHHLFLWQPHAQRIIGAYRLAACGPILQHQGPSGLYSASLFHLNGALQQQLAQAVELGRSFVHPDFWGQGWLALLWAGIGAWLQRHPHIHLLFGPVSISRHYPEPARALLVHFYRHHFPPQAGLAATPKHPFTPPALPTHWHKQLQQPYRLALLELRRLLREMGVQIPTLYRQYTEMGGPQACQFLAFGVDPDFNHCIDGLILADMHRFNPQRRARYLSALQGAGRAK